MIVVDPAGLYPSINNDHGRSPVRHSVTARLISDPALAGLVAERAARQVDSKHHGSPAGRLSVQMAALRSAGFAEVGTLWQRGDSRLLCGVLPA